MPTAPVWIMTKQPWRCRPSDEYEFASRRNDDLRVWQRRWQIIWVDALERH